MLTIVRSTPRTRRFLTYDLEWIPGTMELRICGVYDGKRYRCYRTIEGFLAAELNSENRGVWFYAHAGGMADLLFVFEAILKRMGYDVERAPAYTVNASFSGSSAIIVKVKRGKNCWWFIDSYWLFRDKLRNIAKSVGMVKGGIDDTGDEELSEEAFDAKQAERREWYRSVPLPELIRYNAGDCIILWTAINRFEDALLEWGSVLMKTVASCGMQLFRRRFLKHDIETNQSVNEIARKSYIASRVEVFNRHVEHSFYYDINSSFPHAMTFPQPGALLGTLQGRLPRRPDVIYLADCRVRVPDQYCPPLATRLDGRVFFPTGEWRSWFTSVDLELLQREGGKILRVYESIGFEPFTDLKDYALTIYNHRKQSTDEFQRIVDKYLLNCLYGKFAESPYKESLLIDPPPCNVCGYVDCRCKHRSLIRQLMPGVWLKESIVPIPHMHVPISANITSIARRTIYDYMTNHSRFDYCDTDGFSCPDKIPTGKDLGALKLEKIVDRGEFLIPKVYQIHGKELQTDGSWKEKILSRAKGFSRMNVGRWLRLREGEEIHYERMRRMRELYRDGTIRPQEKKITKRIRFAESVPKRFTYPDGSTRPWSTNELEGLSKSPPKRRK